ncbi:MAG: hypothetical protein QUS14_06370, partial [Pyrinomonadaceae bacterium]|nr:hypothetical protein [Pyrinomonadaceae bacterium]
MTDARENFDAAIVGAGPSGSSLAVSYTHLRAHETALNAIIIDGDMFTNDTALILSPQAGALLKGKDLAGFEEALH